MSDRKIKIKLRASVAHLGSAAVFLLSGCGDSGSATLPPTIESVAFDTVFAVGAPDGEGWDAFGGIWNVAAAPDGRFAILDIETNAVHVVGPDGAHIGSITETGMDPGQLRRPSSITWTDAGDLLVWDPGSSFISTFAVSNSGVEFVDRGRAFAFGETGFCAAGGRAYLSYFQEGQVVHEIGAEGEMLVSFGGAPDPPGVASLGAIELQEIATEELTPSGLLCVSDGVLDISFYQSRMQLHDLDGAPVWSREIEDFVPIVAYTPDGMGLGRRFDSVNGSHLLKSIVPWGESMALVQHEVRTEEIPPEGEGEVIESRLIRLEDGEEMGRTRSLPAIESTQGNRAFEVRQNPYPQVLVLELR